MDQFLKQYDSDKQNLKKMIEDVDKKILNTNKLAQKTDLHSKITEGNWK